MGKQSSSAEFAPLTVVIPTLNAAVDLPATLGRVMHPEASGLLHEVIVSDGGSVDGTTEVAEAAGAKVVSGAAGRGAQIARAIDRVESPWLLVLHADTWLPDGWWNSIAAALHDPDRAYAFRLAFRAPGFFPRSVAAWANLRSRVFALPYGDQGLLISQALCEAVGGYPTAPLMEDVIMADRLGRRLSLLDLTVQTSAARYEAQGWMRRGGRNLLLFTRFRLGADPVALARDYSGQNQRR